MIQRSSLFLYDCRGDQIGPADCVGKRKTQFSKRHNSSYVGVTGSGGVHLFCISGRKKYPCSVFQTVCPVFAERDDDILSGQPGDGPGGTSKNIFL